MSVKEKSNENQTATTAVYRFGDCELQPSERLLKRAGQRVPLAPKAFDALLHLVRSGGRLVTKTELMETLWPSTYVTEASLTNTIVSLRKALGRDAIRTVSKHGYRLELPVAGEPGMSHEVYSRFVRATELTVQRSLEAAQHACELYWTCLAENPGFAPAWSWLGRSAYMLAKFSGRNGSQLEVADAAFRRAFTIDPDLACTHQFYTHFEADMGHARQAMERLLERIQRHPSEPESFAGLVQVFRYCGLLDQSIQANARAQELDPTVITSIPHTLFLAGEYAATIETYGGRAGGYLDAAAWAALGEHRRAVTLLHERIARGAFSGVLSPLMRSLLAVLEDRADEAIDCMDNAAIRHEPEALVYLARHYARLGAADKAIDTLARAAASGFVCSPSTLQQDPWLRSVHSHPDFSSVLKQATDSVADARGLLRRFRTITQTASPS